MFDLNESEINLFEVVAEMRKFYLDGGNITRASKKELKILTLLYPDDFCEVCGLHFQLCEHEISIGNLKPLIDELDEVQLEILKIYIKKRRVEIK